MIPEGITAIDVTSQGAISFTGLAAGSNVLATRVSQGFSELTGLVKVVTSAPGGAVGTLEVRQGPDGTNWDHVDSFAATDGGPGVGLAVKVLSKFVQIAFVVPGATTMDIRFHGLLKVGASP